MTHVFVAPHPDDVALSCGGLIASLRELGQNVAILTVFSGDGDSERLSGYQREALGFGSKALWPVTEAFNRSAILADWPTAALVPSWAATEERLEATQIDDSVGDGGRRGELIRQLVFRQALVLGTGLDHRESAVPRRAINLAVGVNRRSAIARRMQPLLIQLLACLGIHANQDAAFPAKIDQPVAH